MPSNEERREVAARLREKHYELQGMVEPQCIEIQASNRLYSLLECLPKRRDMFLVLADLIEPQERTCRNNDGYCSQCGTQLVCFFRCYTEEDGFTWGSKPYCAGCGAKVVS